MEIVKFDSKVSWTVAMACAFLNFLVLLPTKVSGLFFVEILDRYQVSRNLAGYPAFTITLMRCSGGPFAGYFAERFGINEVMILGSLLAAVGISACFFAEDIAAVTVFLGLIHAEWSETARISRTMAPNAVLQIWQKCWLFTVDIVLQETPQSKSQGVISGERGRHTVRKCVVCVLRRYVTRQLFNTNDIY
ncbi:hypothetical protein AVEN_260742-1 [Araneus ventricosus]|uniref:Uncharacterized protein n=1 Tax=Araneus ventricosus TaxID=182803 RepID=A0A4Y2VJI1_ARAVE|nr:hypothetical protein AVEN_260742-1 [Araneus ventricosus]